MRLLVTLIISLLFASFGQAQDYSGTWTGTLETEQPKVRYQYTVRLEQSGHQLTGVSRMVREGSDQAQEWQLSGIADARYVRFSETATADTAQSCWKGMRLAWLPKGNTWKLEGAFSAPNCHVEGTVSLTKAAGNATPLSTTHPLAGHWVGVLTQEDKNYDFAYEMTLFDGGQGSSSIAIEYGGGVGDHALVWNANTEVLRFDERQILYDASDEGFYWCFKQGTLTLSETETHYVLDGRWEGVLFEGTPCSPGTVRLQKPKEVAEDAPPETVDYTNTATRRVEVVDHLKANDTEILLTLYDNAEEDGDIVTIFLNDRPMLEQIETRHEHQEFGITLQPGDNYLIFHAENLGSSPPNTAALIIRGAGLRRRIILRSDLQTSGTLLITVPEDK